VREQINVAAGHPLSFTQNDIQWSGHAIECRVYAEDPDNNFFPSPGKITHLRVPAGPGIRDDSGVSEGDEVSIHYDPMISKLAAWGRTRAEAIDRLRRALDEYAVGGIKTTLPFFRDILRDDEFIEAQLDTGFISRFNERRQRGPDAPSVSTHAQDARAVEQDMAVIAAALAYGDTRSTRATNHREPQSKWKMAGREVALAGSVIQKAK
jgi:acetyl-CoA carboxylase, biotin carboxylase subunit